MRYNSLSFPCPSISTPRHLVFSSTTAHQRREESDKGTMAENQTEHTDSADLGANAPLTQSTALQLTQAINKMSQQLLKFNNLTQQNNPPPPPNPPHPQPQPAPIPPAPMHQPNPGGYYPKLDDIWRSFYMDFTEVMTIFTAREWLK